MLIITSGTMEHTGNIEDKFRKYLNYCLLNKLQFLIYLTNYCKDIFKVNIIRIKKNI